MGGGIAPDELSAGFDWGIDWGAMAVLGDVVGVTGGGVNSLEGGEMPWATASARRSPALRDRSFISFISIL